ncbi:hypothetical protein P344_03550 [Spiroplasma mirum ATCC 29335]|uniref:Uncharacterized protein n=1 Tax=Spiroplasma mirum ATCC 29335 TaxID=838561 RepID=W6ALY6_9MOLU|nr:hypothetical protein P344_03550 [Spiroplasma mirum ATCC 29335]AKM53129.1 hypothetical protein SATRI_v1c06570 [Spiroplasma atrichopogonis]
MKKIPKKITIKIDELSIWSSYVTTQEVKDELWALGKKN